jgi:hypothetical protein
MFFPGDPVRVIGHVDVEEANNLYKLILKKFNEKWIKRSFKLMDTSYCLKAVSPSNFDALDENTRNELKEILMPWVTPYISDNEVLVYLDVSSLPPGSQSIPHVDYLWIHLLSKRIRIPLITNCDCKFSLLDESGTKTYNLKVGNVYETNNSVLHAAANLGTTPRWHIVADILDKSLYEYLVRTGKLSHWGVSPTLNFLYSSDVVNQLTRALKSDPINI